MVEDWAGLEGLEARAWGALPLAAMHNSSVETGSSVLASVFGSDLRDAACLDVRVMLLTRRRGGGGDVLAPVAVLYTLGEALPAAAPGALQGGSRGRGPAEGEGAWGCWLP